MCCTEDCDTSADEFFKALVQVREQVEAAFAEATAESGSSRPEGSNKARSQCAGNGTSMVSVYLELASRDERTE
jgi:hypothetical protein